MKTRYDTLLIFIFTLFTRVGSTNIFPCVLHYRDVFQDRSYKKALIQKSPVPPTLMQQFLQPKAEPLSPKTSLEQGSMENEGVEKNKDSAGQSLTQQPFSREDCSSKNSGSSGLELALLPQLLLESGVGGVAGLPTDQQGHQELRNSSLPNERQKVWGGQYTADFVPGSEQLTQDEFNVSSPKF